MGEWNENQNPYKVLELTKGHETTDAEIKKAFRKLSLQKHPDKQPDNPNAAEEFQQLKRAYELLLDPGAREAWDALERAKAASAVRRAGQADKRRKMMDDLDRRERVFATERSQEDIARSQLKAELERLRQKHAKERARQEFEDRTARAAAGMVATPSGQQPYIAAEAPGPPQMTEELLRTLKVSWDARDGGYTSEDLRRVFSTHGKVVDVIIRESKKKTKGSALVVMADLASAAKASTASNGRGSNPLLVVPFPKVAGVPAGDPTDPPAAVAPAPGRPTLFPVGTGIGSVWPGGGVGGFANGRSSFPAASPASFPGGGATPAFPRGSASSFPAGSQSFPAASAGSFPGGASSFPAGAPKSFPGGAPSSFPGAANGGRSGPGVSSFPSAAPSSFPGPAAASRSQDPGGLGLGRDFEDVNVSRMRQREERERLIAEMQAQDAVEG